MCARPSAIDRSAFTLVEVLLALTLTGIVLTAASRILVGTVRVSRSIHESVDQHRRTDELFGQLARDLDARLLGLDHAVAVGLDPNHRPEIKIRCLAAEPGESLHTSYLPAEARYRLVSAGHRSSGLRLERSVDWLVEKPPSVPMVEVISEGIASVETELLYDSQWVPLTSKTGRRQAELLRAFRLSLELVDRPAAVTQTFVLEAPNTTGERW